jgi:hypothetical protein
MKIRFHAGPLNGTTGEVSDGTDNASISGAAGGVYRITRWRNEEDGDDVPIFTWDPEVRRAEVADQGQD